MRNRGSIHQILGGQTRDVGTRAAEISLFDDGGADAEGRGAGPAQLFACFARADGYGVVVVGVGVGHDDVLSCSIFLDLGRA